MNHSDECIKDPRIKVKLGQDNEYYTNDQKFYKDIFQFLTFPSEEKMVIGKLVVAPEEIFTSIHEFIKSERKSVDLGSVLGEGGEGSVVEQEMVFMNEKIKCAVKLAYYENIYGEVFGPRFFDHLKESKEFAVGTRYIGKNRIKYLLNTVLKLHGLFFHLTGKFLFKLKK